MHQQRAKTIRAFLASVFVALIAPERFAAAQPLVVTMAPENVEEAIRLAADEKAASRFLDLYVLQNRAGWGNGPRIGIFSTPFSRVVQAAVTARKQGKSFAAAEIAPDLLMPELHVIAVSQKAASDDTNVNVFSVALAPRGSKEKNETLPPLKSTELTPEYQELHGTAFTGPGVVTVFSLNGLPPNCEVRVIFEQTVRGSTGLARCRECTVQLPLDRVR